jgi:hypothetical protein
MLSRRSRSSRTGRRPHANRGFNRSAARACWSWRRASAPAVATGHLPTGPRSSHQRTSHRRKHRPALGVAPGHGTPCERRKESGAAPGRIRITGVPSTTPPHAAYPHFPENPSPRAGHSVHDDRGGSGPQGTDVVPVSRARPAPQTSSEDSTWTAGHASVAAEARGTPGRTADGRQRGDDTGQVFTKVHALSEYRSSRPSSLNLRA